MQLKLALPQGLLELEGKEAGASLLVVAGGRAPAPAYLQHLVRERSCYAVDKGLESYLALQLMPLAAYGDGDSCAPELWEQAKSSSCQLHTYPCAKDATDLQLCLEALPAASSLVISGVWGGRFDHLYANLYSLAAYQQRTQTPVILADEQEVLVLLPGGSRLVYTPKQKPLALSLLPLAERSTVSIDGVQWPLQEAELTQSCPYAVSNVVTSSSVQASCQAGLVGFYLDFESEKKL